jgi:predicted dehydrogenase
MTSSPVKVGILGAGGVTELCHLPVLTRMPGVEVAWLCDQERARAAKLGREWGIRQAFDDLHSCPDVDAVLIAIPVGRRRDALSVIFERGWHAFVEKPFATSADEHARIVREATDAGVEVGVGLMRRFFRSTNVARLALAGGVFGPVLEVWAAEASRLGPTGREGSWYQADPAAAGGGVLMETGSHVVDQVFQALGVEAFDDLRAVFTNADGLDIEVRAVANVMRAGAAEPIRMHLALSRIRDLYTGLVVRCEHATLRLGVAADSLVEVLGGEDRPVCRLEGANCANGATKLYQAFFLEWQAFLEQCRSRTPSLVDAASSLLSTRFIETAYRQGYGAPRP